jgi:CRISPR-associated protein Csd1
MRSHRPLIKRVPGGKQQDRYLVSFEGESFTSYGQKKSYNAPVSVSAVEAYCHALNYLLSNKDHSFTIGDTVLCFWASETDEVTKGLSSLLNRPRPQSVRAFMKSPYIGDSDRAPLNQEDFYSVTLSGNAGRIVVRHWMQMTVKEAIENFKHWFEDLNIVTYGEIRGDSGASPLSILQLALTTVRSTKEREKKFEPEMLTQLYRAALENNKPSLMLAKKIVDRFAVELVRDKKNALYNLSRFALLRLIINRNRKEDDPMIEPILSETDDAAYNCGRLLAIFDELQWAAQGDVGAGVVERYYGAASSAPNTAFGILWRLHQHHLKKLARTGDSGRAKAAALKRKIEEIACRFRQRDPRFPPEFPRAFDMRAQGRFALGFYQQKAAERQARTAYLEARETEVVGTEDQNSVSESTSTQGDSNNE